MYVDEAGIDNREEYAYGYCEIGQRCGRALLDTRLTLRFGHVRLTLYRVG